MKKFIFCVSMLFCLSSFSQKIDTVKNSVQINAVIPNIMKGDTAMQFTWRISVERGKGNEGYGYIVFYNRQGNKIQDLNFVVPASIIDVWLDDSVIDNFILNKYNLTLRK